MWSCSKVWSPITLSFHLYKNRGEMNGLEMAMGDSTISTLEFVQPLLES